MQETGEALLLQALDRMKNGERIAVQTDNELIPVERIRICGPLAVLTRADHSMKVIRTDAVVSIVPQA